MNRQEAIKQKAIKTLQKLQADYNDKHIDYEGANDAYNMAISDMRKMSYLTDRPCAVCKFNEDGKGCKKWTCAFEDDGKENE